VNRLYRLKIKPTSPWRTPWQADTLTGALLATCARVHGSDTLRTRLIDPMLAGHPPFVLSDALPGDLLPFPIHLRLADWFDAPNLKAIKRARWLAPDHFQLARTGHRPAANDLLSDDQVFLDQTRQHNTLSRVTDASFSHDEGGGIYQRPESLLHSQHAADFLSLYFRLPDPSAADLLLDLLYQLSLTGFGADVSTGRGQFDLPDDPQPMPVLDEPPPDANGVISLSTFQPGPTDPTDGYWDAFPKFGKLGPDFGLTNADVRKNTIILFRPGGCFRIDASKPFLGRAIPMQELLSQSTTDQLIARNVHVIHPVLGLTIPIYLPKD
jgi:CRISPR/Cas system CSM-associated protein Csm4 (group 5 of RAMP superfamily)